jgi:hypothetical protein
MTVQQPNQKLIHIFYSYAHKDERFRNQLEEHLSGLKREGVIHGWHDRNITAGQEWANEIDKNLEASQVILLLISASFIASDYCYAKEMIRAIEKHSSSEARVLPFILRPCDWSNKPFSKLQALPKEGKPITKWSNRDEAWTDVAKGIRKVVEELKANPQ